MIVVYIAGIICGWIAASVAYVMVGIAYVKYIKKVDGK